LKIATLALARPPLTNYCQDIDSKKVSSVLSQKSQYEKYVNSDVFRTFELNDILPFGIENN
jgi:hypothetical protein